ncbi:MAG: response regulator transcription factor [Campylobacterales bacterium]|nr:response regulator transcription factor [Campylobacterales bacterium]
MINSQDVTAATKDLSVLFVEDNDDLRENTAEILKKFFKVVDNSQNGEYAMEKYIAYHEENSVHYDIVISDIKMPIMDGVEFTKLIYSINPSQPIIILSAFDDSEYLINLINMGIEQFIKKPIDYQELLKVLQNVSKKILSSSVSLNTKIPTKIELQNHFLYDRENQSLVNVDTNIYLTKYEIYFMQLLTSNVGKIYSNDEIVNYFTSVDEAIDAKNIRKLVSKFRKKLPENCLECTYGIGYKLIPCSN